MKISIIQINSKENDRDSNIEKAKKWIAKAARARPDIIVLPEFFNTEYFPQYRDYKYYRYAEREDGHTISAMRALAQKYSLHIVATIYEEEMPGYYYDTAMVIDPQGNTAGKYRKIHPAAVKSLEKIYFRPGSKFRIFQINGWKVGILICYDYRFPETVRCLALLGAELVIIPFATLGTEMFSRVLPTRAWENSLYIAACNKVGKEGDWVFPGDSMIVDPAGKIIKRAGGKEATLCVEIDLSYVHQIRMMNTVFRDRRPEMYRMIAEYEDEFHSQKV